VPLDENYGYAGGNNRALKLAAEEGFPYAYLLNNDCEVEPGFLARVLETAGHDPRLAAVGSFVCYGDPAGFVQYDGLGHPPGSKPAYEGDAVRPVDFVLGAGALINLAAAERDGYLDERFFCYYEEVEWCRRMQSRGWRLAVREGSRVIHHCRGSDQSANALYYEVRNSFLFSELLTRSGVEVWDRSHAIYEAVLHARKARAAGHDDRWIAIAAGLHDGLRGRYGRRGPTPSRAALEAQVGFWTLWAHARDKLVSLRAPKD